jgi:hypothetical protein
MGGAKLLGKSAAISTLETGELHGKFDYARDLWRLSPSTRLFIQPTVLPEQLRTHNVLRSLQSRM